MSLEVTGRLKKFLEPQTGVKKDASGNWIKQSFLVETDAQYNNLYCFEVFGDEKVANLTKYQKEGDILSVEFNVNTNEYNGNYYTTLAAWKISKQVNETPKDGGSDTNTFAPPQTAFATTTEFNEEEHDDLPF